MSKHNLSIKKIKKQILSINDLIESNFNKLKYFKSNYKKILLDKKLKFTSLSAITKLPDSFLNFTNETVFTPSI